MSELPTKIFTSPFGHVDYCIVTTKEAHDKFVSIYDIDGAVYLSNDSTAYVQTFERGNRALCIVQADESLIKDKVEFYCLIAHEAVHVWQEIRERMSECNPSIEFEAYSIQKILMDLLREVVDD